MRYDFVQRKLYIIALTKKTGRTRLQISIVVALVLVTLFCSFTVANFLKFLRSSLFIFILNHSFALSRNIIQPQEFPTVFERAKLSNLNNVILKILQIICFPFYTPAGCYWAKKYLLNLVISVYIITIEVKNYQI